jgi:hypothetical protein
LKSAIACSRLAVYANAARRRLHHNHRPEEEILTYEVSDEALETAAGSKEVGNYTLACTYFYFCPI